APGSRARFQAGRPRGSPRSPDARPRSAAPGARAAQASEWSGASATASHSTAPRSPPGRGCASRGSSSAPSGPGLVPPPLLPRFGQRVHRVVVLVAALERVRIRELDAGPVVFGPVGDAVLPVVLGDLVNPALSDERHVTDDAWGREA